MRALDLIVYVGRTILRAVCMTVVFGLSNAHAAQAEYLVKAAFLYNFAKFVRWPDEERGATFTVCVLGRDPFDDALDSLQGKQVKGRDITVERINDVDAAADCHMVFVSDSERERLPAILSRLQQHHVLSVSDIDGFASHGGMIGLLTLDNKIRFDVNIASAEAAGLSISSNMLRLARTVHKKHSSTNDT